MRPFDNPFRPGAGHMPPYLAGRQAEIREFLKLLGQTVIMQNLVLTGLRGVGKTVLLDTLRPRAIEKGWAWIGTDLSETSSLSEANLATRLLTDLSVFTSSLVVSRKKTKGIGFTARTTLVDETLGYAALKAIFDQAPGLVADKLKRVLEVAGEVVAANGRRGIVFAYDEAQTLADHGQKDEFPLSVLLDVFQSMQRKGAPFLLLLTGLPTLFPRLVEARTFSERMFHTITLDRLNEADSRQAITKPVERANCPIKLGRDAVDGIVASSGGYPYFIQFICREAFDIYIQQSAANQPMSASIHDIEYKLDNDFFYGRWSKTTDRQRELLSVIADLDHADDEFSVQDVATRSKMRLSKPFTPSHINQMLNTLAELGLAYRNRHGKYSFAVPLLGKFIRRQSAYEELRLDSKD